MNVQTAIEDLISEHVSYSMEGKVDYKIFSFFNQTFLVVCYYLAPSRIATKKVITPVIKGYMVMPEEQISINGFFISNQASPPFRELAPARKWFKKLKIKQIAAGSSIR